VPKTAGRKGLFWSYCRRWMSRRSRSAKAARRGGARTAAPRRRSPATTAAPRTAAR